MKRVLIISPYFPPANTADMQRIRMSLPYFESFGWDTEVVAVNDRYVDTIKDPLLLQSIPDKIKIHRVTALSKTWTSKLGLGSLALRSIWFYWKKVNKLLKHGKFDLIYFSTTAFPLCILGACWKRKFGIPYVIDMQDPWHTEYYQNKPKNERPKKHWFSYRLNKYLEPIAMKKADGLISVSADYIETLQIRYTNLKAKPSAVITFGAFDVDFQIAKENDSKLSLAFKTKNEQINLVYIGRGGYDMKAAIYTLFSTLKKGLLEDPQLFGNIHMHFIGTSYASNDKGIPTVSPLAEKFGLTKYVTEYTNRIGFYQSLKNLQKADGLIIIGSNQAAYTASKLYPYILAKRPLLAILHPDSSASQIVTACKAGYLIGINDPVEANFETIVSYLNLINEKNIPCTDWQEFEPYTAFYMTKKQVELFNRLV
ncbi:glycosyltransferase [Pedobacter rhodius]|uniref:Glycosyltransferase n=1 Tax=Pedobacter rhodius TaxID=3004098 RepID=A0ABT4KU75_9SPHI|nr:glycosyltransferase [Pedobacter sp. SJ11]MCZ4221792.1 glycosyltransferase [Pedobacter sp. SJ11]